MSQQSDEHAEARHATVERSIYGGIRVLDGKHLNTWIDPAGRKRLYAHERAGTWAIGSFYTAPGHPHRPEHTGLHGAPSHSGDGYADDELRRRPWAEDTAAGPARPVDPGTQPRAPQRHR